MEWLNIPVAVVLFLCGSSLGFLFGVAWRTWMTGDLT